MAGSPSASLRPPGTRRPRSRRGARAPKAAAKRLPLRRGPAQAVAPLPWSPLRSRLRCSGFFCERRGQTSATGRVGLEEPAPRPPDRDPRAATHSTPGSTPGGPRGGGGEGQALGRRWTPPVVPARVELSRGRLSGAEPHALSWGYETLDFDQLFPSVAESEQVSDFLLNGMIRRVRSDLQSGPVLPALVDRAGDDITRRRGQRATVADCGRRPWNGRADRLAERVREFLNDLLYLVFA